MGAPSDDGTALASGQSQRLLPLSVGGALKREGTIDCNAAFTVHRNNGVLKKKSNSNLAKFKQLSGPSKREMLYALNPTTQSRRT